MNTSELHVHAFGNDEATIEERHWLKIPYQNYTKYLNDNFKPEFRSHQIYSLMNNYDVGFRCFDPATGDAFSTAHIYGSADTGPYNTNIMNSEYLTLTDTKPRVEFILENYIRQFGFPDLLIIHAGVWESKLFRRQNESWRNEHLNETMRQYEINMNRRIDHIEAIIKNFTENTYYPGHSQIGLRTTMVHRESNEYAWIFAANDVMRKVSKERELILYDYCNDVWSLEDFNYSSSHAGRLFRDNTHPNRRQSVIGAQKLLGLRYSTEIHNYGLIEVENRTGQSLPQILRQMVVYLIRSGSQLYFIHRMSDVNTLYGRWSLNEDAMPILKRILWLRSTDILKWNIDQIVQLVTRDQGHFPFDTGSASGVEYVLAMLQDNRNSTVRAVISEGCYYVISDEAIWNSWKGVTPPTAVIESPLKPFWSQYESSILTNCGEIKRENKPGSLLLY